LISFPESAESPETASAACLAEPPAEIALDD
jgi:hypothetical protein